MISDGLILPCRDCGKAIAVVKVGGVLAYGHLVNPTFMHHEAKPPAGRGHLPGRLARTGQEKGSMGRLAAVLQPNPAQSEVSATRRPGVANAGTSPDPALVSGRAVPANVHAGSPRPSEEGAMLRHPSSAPRLPLSAGARSRAAGGG